MGSSKGSQVVYYVPESQAGGEGAEAQKVVTPAVAKSIAGDTARAQEMQSQERQRAFGISSTYNRYKTRGVQSGNNTLGGS